MADKVKVNPKLEIPPGFDPVRAMQALAWFRMNAMPESELEQSDWPGDWQDPNIDLGLQAPKGMEAKPRGTPRVEIYQYMGNNVMNRPDEGYYNTHAFPLPAPVQSSESYAPVPEKRYRVAPDMDATILKHWVTGPRRIPDPRREALGEALRQTRRAGPPY